MLKRRDYFIALFWAWLVNTVVVMTWALLIVNDEFDNIWALFGLGMVELFLWPVLAGWFISRRQRRRVAEQTQTQTTVEMAPAASEEAAIA